MLRLSSSSEFVPARSISIKISYSSFDTRPGRSEFKKGEMWCNSRRFVFTYTSTPNYATKYLNDYYTNLWQITIAPGARSEGYRHPPCSLTTVRRPIATYRTMAHSLSYHYEFGSSPLLTGTGSYYVRTVVLALHCQTLPNFNVG
jgi:hypothetical protein